MNQTTNEDCYLPSQPDASSDSATGDKDSVYELNTKKQLPIPKGWRILVAMPEAEEKTDGGIVKSKQTIRDEEISNICGYVLKIGSDCYNDKKRFPTGPWCKTGDWVVFRAYSGTRLKIYGKEFRIINDDTVEAVAEDPTGVVMT